MIDRQAAIEEVPEFASDYSVALRNTGSDSNSGTCPARKGLQARVAAHTSQELGHVEELMRNALSSRYPEVSALCQVAASMGGKRLRPMLVLLSAAACQGAEPTARQRSDARAIAAAVELVHAASLVHDDVMDAAATRRHQPTIVAAAGNSAAVLLGDFLFTRAYALAASCRGTLPARSIAAAATKLCTGELRQQQSSRNWELSMADYRSLLLQKTGALCAVSCRLGGWTRGADAATARGLHRFGNLLGLAFQIFDDWLDYWGLDQVGKTLGTDLAHGKPTLPLIHMLSVASHARRLQLLRLLEQNDEAARAEVLQQLNASSASEITLATARHYAQLAQQQLQFLPSSDAKDCLSAIADYSVRREL